MPWQVWVVPSLGEDGKIYWQADSDSQLTKVLGAVTWKTEAAFELILPLERRAAVDCAVAGIMAVCCKAAVLVGSVCWAAEVLGRCGSEASGGVSWGLFARCQAVTLWVRHISYVQSVRGALTSLPSA